jgi:hypothetical protein
MILCGIPAVVEEKLKMGKVINAAPSLSPTVGFSDDIKNKTLLKVNFFFFINLITIDI